MSVLNELNAALEPRHPVYTIDYKPGSDDAHVQVYVDCEMTYSCDVSISVALEMLADAHMVSLDLDGVDDFDVVRQAMLMHVAPPTAVPAPETINLGQLVSKLVRGTQLHRSIQVTVEGVDYRVIG